jgi:hypothetical protein
MNRPVETMGVAVVVIAAAVFVPAVFAPAEEEARKSEIATFESVQQNKDYRVSLLGITKGIAFVDSQELIDGGGRPPGKHAVPWMRVDTVIEKLTDKTEPLSFAAETSEGDELVGKLRIERNGQIVTGRMRSVTEIDSDAPSLRLAIFPVGLPAARDATKSKVYSFTLSGKFPRCDTMVLRFSFGGETNGQELVFNEVPMP